MENFLVEAGLIVVMGVLAVPTLIIAVEILKETIFEILFEYWCAKGQTLNKAIPSFIKRGRREILIATKLIEFLQEKKIGKAIEKAIKKEAEVLILIDRDTKVPKTSWIFSDEIRRKIQIRRIKGKLRVQLLVVVDREFLYGPEYIGLIAAKISPSFHEINLYFWGLLEGVIVDAGIKDFFESWKDAEDANL